MSQRAKAPQEQHCFLDRVFSSFALQGPLCFPESAWDAWLPRDRRQATTCTHTLGQARVWATWRRKAPVRPLHPTCLPHLCRSQDRRRPRPRPRLRSQSSPWSQRRALSAHCLARPAARTCCPSQCFMGRWTLKTHSWPPVRRRSRSC